MGTRNKNRFETLGTGLETSTLAGVAYHMVLASLVVSTMALAFLTLLMFASQNWVLIPAFVLYLVSLPTLLKFVSAWTRRGMLRSLGKVQSA